MRSFDISYSNLFSIYRNIGGEFEISLPLYLSHCIHALLHTRCEHMYRYIQLQRSDKIKQGTFRSGVQNLYITKCHCKEVLQTLGHFP